jgi:hypothetical protein
LPKYRLPLHLRDALAAKPLSMQKAIIGCLAKLEAAEPGRSPKGTKKVQGTRDVFESRASRSDRVTWRWDDGVMVILNHCNHDILQRPYG